MIRRGNMVKLTVDEVKYNLEEFKDPVRDNPEFYDELKEKIIAKIKHVESEEVFEEIVFR
jgi:hypothetical protein